MGLWVFQVKQITIFQIQIEPTIFLSFQLLVALIIEADSINVCELMFNCCLAIGSRDFEVYQEIY